MTPPVVEVVARHRGRIVDLRHLCWTEPAAVGPRALLGLGALLVGVGLFLALRGVGVGVVLVALGLVPLALAGIRWRDRPGTRYVIGEGPEVELTVGLAPPAAREAFPLVIALADRAVLGLPPGARGEVAGERPVDLAEALAQGRRSVALPAEGRALLELGELSFEVRLVEPAALEPTRWQVDRLSLVSHVGAAAVLGGLLLFLEPGPKGEVTPAEDERFERVARYLTAIERPKTPPEVARPPDPPRRVKREAPTTPPRPEPAAPPKLEPDASPEEVARVEQAVTQEIARQRGAARRKDGTDSEFDYDRTAGVLGNEKFIEKVDEFTMTGRAGMIAYMVTPEDDALWDQMTKGPPNMARHFGGLELAKTERGGGESKERETSVDPPASKATPIEAPKPKTLTPEQEARLRRFVTVEIDPPSLAADAGLDKIGLYHYVREHVEGLRGCYEDALDRDPKVQGVGKLVIRFDAAGEVTEARFAFTTGTIASIEPCLLKAAKRWRPQPAEPKPTAAVFHLHLSAYSR